LLWRSAKNHQNVILFGFLVATKQQKVNTKKEDGHKQPSCESAANETSNYSTFREQVTVFVVLRDVIDISREAC
jgi:hypothetical protein